MPETAYHHGNLRAALLDAALVLLAAEGAEAVTLRALARATGVSHAAPARHFATRDALFAALAEHGFLALTAAVAAARERPGGPLERLRAMAMAHLGWALENPALYGAMRNPEVMRHAPDSLRARIAAFAQVQMGFVQAARAEGWRAGEPAGATLMSIVAGLTGLAALMTDPFYAAVAQGFGAAGATGPLIDRLLAP
jgi:AcrR family transcriptional regulator